MGEKKNYLGKDEIYYVIEHKLRLRLMLEEGNRKKATIIIHYRRMSFVRPRRKLVQTDGSIENCGERTYIYVTYI